MKGHRKNLWLFVIILRAIYNLQRINLWVGRLSRNYVYILRCGDDSLYTGWTNNLEKRVKAHSNGKGAKYTKARLPIELVYFEEFEDKIEAMRREYAIKKLTRKEKLLLIKKPLTM